MAALRARPRSPGGRGWGRRQDAKLAGICRGAPDSFEPPHVDRRTQPACGGALSFGATAHRLHFRNARAIREREARGVRPVRQGVVQIRRHTTRWAFVARGRSILGEWWLVLESSWDLLTGQRLANN